MSVAFERIGLHKEAVEEFLKDGRIRGFLEREESESLRKAFKESGWRGFERMRINLLEQKSKKEHLPPTLLAGVYALAEEKDAAFAWLEKAIYARDGWVALIKIQPAYDNLRNDPRYTKLLTAESHPIGADSTRFFSEIFSFIHDTPHVMKTRETLAPA